MDRQLQVARRRARRQRRSIPLWRRSELVPAAWRIIDDEGMDSFGRSWPGPSVQVFEVWRLSMEAAGIPHMIIGHGDNHRLFVPPMWEGKARYELAALKAESLRRPIRPIPALHNIPWAILVMLLLVAWHGLITGWWSLPFEHLPESAHWIAKGKLDVYRVAAQGELYRAVTALTLHADGSHLLGNFVFGTLFFISLCRRLGVGLAWGLTILSGIMGNMLNVLYQPFTHTSLGFSTALFGMLGLLSADIAVREREYGLKRRIFLPMAAAVGLLAMLGAHGGRTDYAAHIFGLLSGYAVGLPTGIVLLRWGRPPKLLNLGAGLAGGLVLVWAWRLAFA